MRVCTARILSVALAILLCCTPEVTFAISAQASGGQQPSATPPSSTPNNGSPSATPPPDAPQPAQNPATPHAQNSTTQTPQAPQPQGTAAARAAKTIGGPASKPAGSAIAPAKQRQMRSLLIRVGAIVAAGATVGTVYALTRGSPARPPGAR